MNGSNEERRWTTVIAASSFPRYAALYAALFAAFGTESPFFPSLLEDRGLDAREVGLVLTAGTLVRLSTGAPMGNLADRVGAKRVLAATAMLAGLIGLLYLAARGFWPLLAVAMVHSLAVSPLAAISDSLALAASVRETTFSYGWVRGVGSGAFVLGTLLSGLLVPSFGTAIIIVSSSFLFLVMVPPALTLADSTEAVHAGASRGIRTVLAIPAFRHVLAIAALVIGSHATSDAFAVIQWRHAGIAPPVVSLLWSEAVLAEVVVFFLLGPAALTRLGPVWCTIVAAGAGIVRWAALATTVAVPALIATQLLHGLTFALMHLACMALIAEACPARLSATAQSVYGTLALGLASAVLTALSGVLYQWSGAAAFWLMAALCAAAIPVSLSLRRHVQTAQA